MGRTATWDIYCHAFMMGAIYYLYLALRQNPCKWTYFIGAGLFMGLSFLGKGPVSFYALLLPFVCAYILYYRKETQMKGKWIALAVMILIGIVLSTWWYAYIYIYHQEMASYVFHKESSSWSNHNVRSWYYYWQFFLETGVWSLLTLTTLLVPFWKKRVESSKEYLFCLSLDVTDPFLFVPASGKENTLSAPDIVARSPDNGTSICILDSAGKTKNATT